MRRAVHLCCPCKHGTEINVAPERVIYEVTWNGGGALASTVDQDGVIIGIVNKERVITGLWTHF